MKFQELIVLLPCHSLEDFPQHHEGEDADSLLACWTALWHPELLASANSPPNWYRVDEPPEELTERLILVPTVSDRELPAGFVQRAEDAGACLIRGEHDRQTLLHRALDRLQSDTGSSRPELAADFLALGYYFLQIQLLTRQMRYSSNLDEVHFYDQLLAGARAAVQGQEEQAHAKLTACFDLLAEERDHYYSVDAYLLDLTLIAPQTVGPGLRSELEWDVCSNLLLSGESLNALAETQPETLACLRDALGGQRVGIAGGELCERRLPLMACESILGELRRGQACYAQWLNQPVNVFARRRFGLVPTLPQILDKLGYEGALHATLDDGRFPEGTQVKTRWEGTDGSAIDAIARAPLDASKPETFLGLAHRLGESMDMDHVATLCLAHWPGWASLWYDDLRRGARYAAALGKFVTAQEYFRETYMPGHLEWFDADQYRSPYLKQSIIHRQPDPISTIAGYWQRRVQFDTIEAMTALASLVGGSRIEGADDLASRIDRSSDQPDGEALDEQLQRACCAAAERLANVLPRQQVEAQPGYLVVNPWNFVRRLCVETPQLPQLPPRGKPVYAAADTGSTKRVVVDVPPMGFAWLAAGDASPAKRRKSPPPLAEDRTAQDGGLILRNEFFEATFDATTGALQLLKDYHSRGNRLSQQLGYRLPAPRPSPGESWRDPDDSAVYSVMAADEVQVVESNSAVGALVVRGRLLDRSGQSLANYRQTFRVFRGSRLLELDIELDPQLEPKASPWNSYLACRFAWADEAAEVFRAVNQTHQETSKKRIESPQSIEIRSGETRTAILTGGLPYHRRIGPRMLDSLLVVRGERQRSFRLAIGVDLLNPIQEATAWLAPPVVLSQHAPPPSPATSAWLFHLDSRSILATHWAPVVDEGKVVGFTVRLLETTGRPARTRLRGFRPVESARRLDFRGNSLGDCQIDEGRIVVDLAPHEWTELAARWE